jgi:hypothetical protein
MKRILVLFSLIAVFSFSAYSQESVKKNEVGLFFQNLDAFGFRYKFGGDICKLRLTGLSLSLGKVENPENATEKERKYAGFGLNVGLECPIKIDDSFSFFYGGEIQSSYNSIKTENRTSSPYIYSNTKEKITGIGFGVVLGFTYAVNPKISVSAEIVPNFMYIRDKVEDDKSSRYNLGITNNGAGITIGYKF